MASLQPELGFIAILLSIYSVVFRRYLSEVNANETRYTFTKREVLRYDAIILDDIPKWTKVYTMIPL